MVTITLSYIIPVWAGLASAQTSRFALSPNLTAPAPGSLGSPSYQDCVNLGLTVVDVGPVLAVPGGYSRAIVLQSTPDFLATYPTLAAKKAAVSHLFSATIARELATTVTTLDPIVI